MKKNVICKYEKWKNKEKFAKQDFGSVSDHFVKKNLTNNSCSWLFHTVTIFKIS